MKLWGNGVEVQHLLVTLDRDEISAWQSALSALQRDFDQRGYHAHVSTSDDALEITFAPHVGES